MQRRNSAPRASEREARKMNIAIAGAGYVGLSLAVLLSQHNHVDCVTTTASKA